MNWDIVFGVVLGFFGAWAVALIYTKWQMNKSMEFKNEVYSKVNDVLSGKMFKKKEQTPEEEYAEYIDLEAPEKANEVNEVSEVIEVKKDQDNGNNEDLSI